MSYAVEYDATQIISTVRLLDIINNLPLQGVLWNDPNLELWYQRNDGLVTTFPAANRVNLNDDWLEGGWTEVREGYYKVCTPDAAFVSPGRGVTVGATDITKTSFSCIADFHPLQRVVEAVSFTTDGELYCTDEDIFDIFGREAVLKWANMDSLDAADPNYQIRIDARITKAITYASRDFDDIMRGGIYELPFIDTSLTATVNYATAVKAGVWLYEWRGADDYAFEEGRLVHRYTFMADRANTMVEQIRSDARRLNAQATKIGSNVPGVSN